MHAQMSHAGETLRHTRTAGIEVSEVMMPRGLSLPAHAHPVAQMCLVLEGAYQETQRGRLLRMGPGTFLFRRGGEDHANHFPLDNDVLALLIDVHDASLASSFGDATSLHIRKGFLSMAAEVRSELEREEETSTRALEALAVLLGIRASRAASLQNAPDWLRAAEDIIAREHGIGLSLRGLAARVEIHPATLAAGFRRYRQKSVGDVLTEARLRQAVDALTSTTAPISEIAIACGFYDQSHLGRMLKRLLGVTPAEARARRSRLHQ